MAERNPRELVPLAGPEIGGGWIPQDLGAWRVSWARHREVPTLLWHFAPRRGEPGAGPRIDSIRRRCERLVRRFPEVRVEPAPPGGDHDADREGVHIVDRAIEGEPLVAYIRRTGMGPGGAFRFLMLDVIEALRDFVPEPRLLAGLRLDDFFVKARAGIHLQAVCCPVFAAIRDETPMSDHEIAHRWVEDVARLYVVARRAGAVELHQCKPRDAKPFRRLLKRLRSGKEMSLGDCIVGMARALQPEGTVPESAPGNGRRVPSPAAVPRGALSEWLHGELARTYPDRLRRDEPGSNLLSRFLREGYHLSGAGDHEPRLVRLLPPDCWFERSVLGPVNRQMGTPFLASHFNAVKTRAILCENGFTALFGDPGNGISLPSLLEARGGLRPAEVLLLAGKLGRALQHFESVEFILEIESPWQIEIHPVNPPGRGADVADLFAADFSDWPAWEMKIRVEQPAEALFRTAETKSWRWVQERLFGKSFPALVIWMLDWKRFFWAAEHGVLRDEPLNWDPGLAALFAAAIEFLEPENPAHRTRFLEFIAEAFDIPRETISVVS